MCQTSDVHMYDELLYITVYILPLLPSDTKKITKILQSLN